MTLFGISLEESMGGLLPNEVEAALVWLCRRMEREVESLNDQSASAVYALVGTDRDTLKALADVKDVISDSMLLLGTEPFTQWVQQRYPTDLFTDVAMRQIMGTVLTDLWLDP